MPEYKRLEIIMRINIRGFYCPEKNISGRWRTVPPGIKALLCLKLSAFRIEEVKFIGFRLNLPHLEPHEHQSLYCS
jgi:hypothetical protein